MRLVIATVGLERRGGVHSYLEAILPEMEALGHEVFVVAPEFGLPDVITAAGGLPCRHFSQVPRPVDGVIAFVDHPALSARAAFPDVPLVFVSHGPWYEQDLPPAEAMPAAVVALSDLTELRLRQSSAVQGGAGLLRLSQPARFRVPPAANIPPDRPKQAIVVAHHLEFRREAIRSALDGLGVEARFVGGQHQDNDVVDQIATADFVVGIGRVVVEAMASGRPCLVLGDLGGGKWLTADSHRELEGSGFFLASDVPGPGALMGILADYQPEFGRAGLELALKHHSPALHVAAIVGALAESRGTSPDLSGLPERSLQTTARARREMHEARITAKNSAWWASEERRKLIRRLDDMGTLEADVSKMIASNEELRSEVARVRKQLDAVYRSFYWRLSAPLRRFLRLIRRH